MVMDEFGTGQAVQHSFLETNADWHMMKAIDHFVSANENTKLLRVIVVDKDLNEIKVLQQAFPGARILLCSFHVIQWLAKACRQPEYGRIATENQKQVDALIHNMIYASSVEKYDANHTSLQTLCSRIGFDSFFDYFDRNWDTCQVSQCPVLARSVLGLIQVFFSGHVGVSSPPEASSLQDPHQQHVGVCLWQTEGRDQANYEHV